MLHRRCFKKSKPVAVGDTLSRRLIVVLEILRSEVMLRQFFRSRPFEMIPMAMSETASAARSGWQNLHLECQVQEGPTVICKACRNRRARVLRRSNLENCLHLRQFHPWVLACAHLDN